MQRRSIAVGAILLGIGLAHPIGIQGQAVSWAENRDLRGPSISFGQELAQAHNPRLDAVRASALATASRVAEASTLPDPTSSPD